MCGIAGFVKQDQNSTIQSHRLVTLLKGLETRGQDATGFAYFTNKNYVIKGNYTASKFLKKREVKRQLVEAGKARWALFHTRAATNGTAANNRNNHPIWSKEGLIIHNGIIWTSEKLQKQGDTDTEELLLLMEKFGKLEGIKKVSGWLSIAYHPFSEPNVIYLYHSCSLAPLWWAFDNGILFFASTKEILLGAFPVKVVQEVPKGILYKVEYGKVTEVGKAEPKLCYVYSMQDDDWDVWLRDSKTSDWKKWQDWRRRSRKKPVKWKGLIKDLIKPDKLIYGQSGKVYPLTRLETEV